MISTKEAELITAVLMYAMRCKAEGDQSALRAMNFGPNEIDALGEMNLGDLYHVETLRAHCLKIMLNRETFWLMIDHLHRRHESEALQKALIAADASHEMMQTFFGLGSREYSHLRRMLAVAGSLGRPPEPDSESIRKVWEAWNRHSDRLQEGLLAPELYLEIHEETGVSLRSIWGQTCRWSEYGALSETSADAPAQSSCADG